MRLYYENSAGKTIDFFCDEITAQTPETLLSAQWSYSFFSQSSEAVRINRFYRDVRELTLKLSIMTDTEEEFREILHELHTIMDVDVFAKTSGKIWWGNYYQEVYAVEIKAENYEELFDFTDLTITFLAPRSCWITRTTYHFSGNVEADNGIDFPIDFLFDFAIGKTDEIIQNPAAIAADFEIIFYGPFLNPYVRIGGNEYGLEIQLQDGEYAVINSREKIAAKYSNIGEKTNVFSSRKKENYIFDQILPGQNEIVRPEQLTCDITIYTERSMPL